MTMKGKTLRQLVKESGKDEYVLVTREFGYPLYIGELDEHLKITVTANLTEAKKWGALDAGHEGKLSFHRIITGYNGLKFEKSETQELETHKGNNTKI
jgi:hypothetical protein